jgi:hypothetical protein
MLTKLDPAFVGQRHQWSATPVTKGAKAVKAAVVHRALAAKVAAITSQPTKNRFNPQFPI